MQAGIIYPTSDSQWVSPIQVVPNKTVLTVIKNEKEEMIPTRVQNNWRVCIDYRRYIEEEAIEFCLEYIEKAKPVGLLES